MNETTTRAWRSNAWRSVAWLLGLAGLLLVAATTPAAEAGKASPSASLKEVKASLDAARDDLSAGRPTKALAKFSAAVADLEKVLEAEDRPPSGARACLDLCKSLRNDLELEGVDVSAIAIPSLKKTAAVAGTTKPADAPDDMKKGADAFFGRPPALKPVGQVVSFSRDVAPVLVRACGGCHIAGKRGNFQFASYADLMQTGFVQRGVGESSRLVEVILSGDMPRGGGTVAPDEIGALMKWIDAGAVFDGPDPRQPLQAMQAAAPPKAGKAAPQAVLVAQVEPGQVSFASDVAPVLVESCLRCHGGPETEAGFSMKTFDRLLAGGRSGEAVLPKRGASSLLVKKIKGKDIKGQRMPFGRDPLSDAVIALIERWIDEGARLDSQSAGEELAIIAARSRTRGFSHAKLRDLRFAAATNLWHRAIPDTAPEIERGEDVSVVGNLSASRMRTVLAEAEGAWADLGGELTAEKPLLKGGAAVFAFDTNSDFSDFWLVRFGRERPKGISGAGGMNGDAAYAALVVPDDATSPDAKLLITEQLVAAAVAGRGAPAWFGIGLGRALAAARVPKAPLATAWRKQMPESIRQIASADGLFAEEPTDSEAWRIAAGGFVGSLVGKTNRGRLVISKLDEGVPFAAAFQDSFGGLPEQLFTAWAAKEMARSQRR